MTVNTDDVVYVYVKDKFSKDIADNLFSYALTEYACQPTELKDTVPDFFEELEKLLYPDTEYDWPKIKNMLDDSFIDYYLVKRNKYF